MALEKWQIFDSFFLIYSKLQREAATSIIAKCEGIVKHNSLTSTCPNTLGVISIKLQHYVLK